MKSISLRHIGPAAVLAGMCAAAVLTAVAEQAPGDDSASMVKPPQPPASGANAHNPDNMPVHRPKQPTNDPIARPPPASAANAK